MIRRREFMTLLGGAAATWPVATPAQQTDRVRQIGVLASGTKQDPIVQARLAVFRQALEKLGWMEHRNVRIDYRFAQASTERGQVLAKELVALRPDVIFAQTTPMVAVLQRESRAVPIVFIEVSDPINSGFAASLARPGGNFTGALMSYGADRVDAFRQAASFVDRILRGANPGELPVQAPTKYETVLNLKTAKALGLTVPPGLLVAADEVIE